MKLPPISIPAEELLGYDKRVTVQLQKYWDLLRDYRNFPSELEIDPTELAEIWDNCFIVSADNSCRKEDYKYKYLGSNIRKISNKDLAGLKVDALEVPEASHLADQYELVLARKLPVYDEGTITLHNKNIIKYRQILLPLGTDGINITAIIGGMSYKMVENEKKSFFMRFRRKK